MKFKRLSICVAAFCVASFLSGCASMTSPMRTHALEAGKPYAIDYDATRRGAYILPGDRSMKMCAEPAPDVAMESITNIIANLKLQQANADANAQVELQQKIVELAGRTQLVLVLRESLYRLCEQGVNGQLNNEQIAALYKQALDTVLRLADTDLAKEQRAIIENLKDPALRDVFRKNISTGTLKNR